MQQYTRKMPKKLLQQMSLTCSLSR